MYSGFPFKSILSRTICRRAGLTAAQVPLTRVRRERKNSAFHLGRKFERPREVNHPMLILDESTQPGTQTQLAWSRLRCSS